MGGELQARPPPSGKGVRYPQKYVRKKIRGQTFIHKGYGVSVILEKALYKKLYQRPRGEKIDWSRAKQLPKLIDTLKHAQCIYLEKSEEKSHEIWVSLYQKPDGQLEYYVVYIFFRPDGSRDIDNHHWYSREKFRRLSEPWGEPIWPLQLAVSLQNYVKQRGLVLRETQQLIEDLVKAVGGNPYDEDALQKDWLDIKTDVLDEYIKTYCGSPECEAILQHRHEDETDISICESKRECSCCHLDPELQMCLSIRIHGFDRLFLLILSGQGYDRQKIRDITKKANRVGLNFRCEVKSSRRDPVFQIFPNEKVLAVEWDRGGYHPSGGLRESMRRANKYVIAQSKALSVLKEEVLLQLMYDSHFPIKQEEVAIVDRLLH